MTLFTDKVKLASRAGETKYPRQPKTVRTCKNLIREIRKKFFYPLKRPLRIRSEAFLFLPRGRAAPF